MKPSTQPWICRRNSVSARETGDFRQDASWASPWMLLEGKEIKLRTIREGLKFNFILLKQQVTFTELFQSSERIQENEHLPSFHRDKLCVCSVTDAHSSCKRMSNYCPHSQLRTAEFGKFMSLAQGHIARLQ